MNWVCFKNNDLFYVRVQDYIHEKTQNKEKQTENIVFYGINIINGVCVRVYKQWWGKKKRCAVILFVLSVECRK